MKQGVSNKTDLMVCAMCGGEFEARGKAAQFCPDCKPKRAKENHAKQWQKDKEKRKAMRAERRRLHKPSKTVMHDYRHSLKVVEDVPFVKTDINTNECKVEMRGCPAACYQPGWWKYN